MKILFIADPITALKPKSDSTLALVRAGLRKQGWEIFWCQADDIKYHLDDVTARVSQCVECEQDALPSLGGQSTTSLSQFDRIFIRKDPPFDLDYVRLAWILSLVEERSHFINRPSSLLRFHEKLLPLEALHRGHLTKEQIIPTLIGQVKELLPAVSALGWTQIITKPFLGFAGRGVELWSIEELTRSCAIKAVTIVQPYCERVRQVGDRRVFYLNGKAIGDIVRMPKDGGFISNLAQGGTAVSRSPEVAERRAIAAVGRFLSDVGICLAGADFIGPLVSEINITSPTGIQSIRELEGRDISEQILDGTTDMRHR